MLRHFFVLLPALFFISSCNKNNDPKPDDSGLFIKFFGHAGNSTGFVVAEASDGFVLAGSGSDEGRSDLDMYIVKTDKNGNRMWEKRISGAGRDEARALRIDGSGNIHVVGVQELDDNSTDLLYVVLNSGGTIVTQELFGDPAKSEEGLFVSFTNDNAVLMAGLRRNTSNQSMYILKYIISDDSLAWDREVGIIGLTDEIGSIIQLPDSSLIWSGTANKSSESNIRLVKSDKEGNFLWTKEFGELNNTYEYCRRMMLTSNNELFLVGSIGKEKTSAEGMYILKADLDGNKILSNNLYASQSGAYGLAASSDGGYFILGYHMKTDTDSDFLLVKTDASGNQLWTKEFGGTRKDYGYSVLASDDGGIVMAGVADVFEEKNTVVSLLKTDREGNLNKTK